MVKKALILSFIFVAFLACAQKEGGGNKPTTKYLNLDFEDAVPNGEPKFWMAGGMGYEAVIDKIEVNSGKRCLRMKSVSTNRTFGVATSFFPIDIARGKRIRYSGFIKTQNVQDGHAGLWWRVDGSLKPAIAFDNMADRGPKETTDWQEYVIELDVPEEGSNINFGVLLVGTGTAWFDNLQIVLDGNPYEQIRPVPVAPKKADLKWIRKNAIPIDTADPASGHAGLMPLRDMIGERPIVALGEGTHGTSEFFKMKHRIVRFLAEEMGFTVFAIEANMPEARKVNRYVLTGEGDPRRALSGLYFWTWDTSEVLAMIEWMKEYNLSGKGRMEFYGFDMQFPDVAMQNVREFVEKADPEFMPPLEEHYRQVDAISQAVRKTRDRGNIDFAKWYDAAKKVHEHLKAQRDAYVGSFDALEVDWAVQDALIVFGFAFHSGEYTAVGQKGIDVYGTSPSEPGSVEWFLQSSGIPQMILDLRAARRGEKGAEWLLQELEFRSIGAMAVSYAFSPRKITEEFDALIYFSKTTPSDCFRSRSR